MLDAPTRLEIFALEPMPPADATVLPGDDGELTADDVLPDVDAIFAAHGL